MNATPSYPKRYIIIFPYTPFFIVYIIPLYKTRTSTMLHKLTNNSLIITFDNVLYNLYPHIFYKNNHGEIMQLIRSINEFLWGYPILIILMGTHLYFTFRLKFIQKKTFLGIKLSITPETAHSTRQIPHSRQASVQTQSHTGGLSSFSALMTTLAATLGTGNIIGMSTAVALGGPGAVFWCWMTGILGMATSYAECYICHYYRQPQYNGSPVKGCVGGPMYIFANVLKQPLLSLLYSIAIVTASLFVGCATQSNSIALTTESAFHIPPEITGIVCALLVAIVLTGGHRVIGRFCSFMVPFMGIFYILCCVILLYLTKDSIQNALNLVMASAFSKESLTGGVLGGGITATLRYGIARGLFTNEAGMGSAGIAAASADTQNSSRQALISMTGVFWDTVVMCGITGILIVANFLEDPARILACSAGELTLSAFSLLPFGEQLLAISLILFAISTIIGWYFFGEQAMTFLTKSEKKLTLFKCAYLVLVFAGALLSLDVVWELTDFINLFLLLPNIYLLWRLRKKIA